MNKQSYKFTCDATGIIYISTAPFFDAKESKVIGDYLPIFTDANVLEDFVDVKQIPYEFNFGDQTYFVDISVDRKVRNKEVFYEVGILDNTAHYIEYQKERSTKNKFKIKNEKLIQLNKRLVSKSIELEYLIQYTLESEIKSPVQSIFSAISLMSNKLIDLDPAVKKLLDLSIVDLLSIEKSISSLLEYQKMSSSRTFKDSAFCSINEILEQTLNTVSSPNVSIVTAATNDRLVFVNKYHFSRTFQKLISFLTKEIKMQNSSITLDINFDNANAVNVSISTQATIDEDKINRIKAILSQEGTVVIADKNSGSVVDVKVARKIVDLYDGTLNFVNNGKKLAIEMAFDSLISKAI